jgi:hypothetical protein
MYSCFFLLPFACWMCTQADRKLDLIGVIEKEVDNGSVYNYQSVWWLDEFKLVYMSEYA